MRAHTFRHSSFAQPTQPSLQSTEAHTAESLLFPCPRHSSFAQPTQPSLQSTEAHTAESLLFLCPRYCNNLKETP